MVSSAIDTLYLVIALNLIPKLYAVFDEAIGGVQHDLEYVLKAKLI
jgi:hypothetical protein